MRLHLSNGICKQTAQFGRDYLFTVNIDGIARIQVHEQLLEIDALCLIVRIENENRLVNTDFIVVVRLNYHILMTPN